LNTIQNYCLTEILIKENSFDKWIGQLYDVDEDKPCVHDEH